MTGQGPRLMGGQYHTRASSRDQRPNHPFGGQWPTVDPDDLGDDEHYTDPQRDEYDERDLTATEPDGDDPFEVIDIDELLARLERETEG